ncbi:UBA/ThiF-type NAD/FAD binding protein [Amycolatopsis mediterranei S699]|uniref:UBA/ThiF-type NAD/FAD binding protein n=2 Tax=Amycolatopsis mediterranei TaxID=33910 RepID=A0A0H3D006_AMYMU|nr:ThiF family adenylyltransferase [Amycolatopsis mediterranei]ADJ43938.1 UBA/ThiF-type NAD/FAD binding protein [Amycolatopsis mediterranei U32]AEK40664.1 UBA/ThiF-type NAD/FAD binding protein [Amycolatopsis mediterranei S699]AFO75651.1 UBA/ThiF-type NAD/FAD binding protein [Amycolatopsis mediterranei S699]AGT82780.1 UBA/ThiF-type NAD/FAD binding protein [Amycolatopsis mediterranei RB]KDO04263.1 thiamine biosynthesis protein ThiF [Amycolatopsis mediterranei]
MVTQSMTLPASLHVPPALAEQLFSHLFPGDGDEHGAVIGATVVETQRGTRFLARRLYLAKDGVDYVPGKRGYRMLTAAFIRDRIKDCEREGLAYFAVHCHGGTDHVDFSRDDLASHERGYPALLDNLEHHPVGGLVFARNAAAGDIWLQDGSRVELNATVFHGARRRVFQPAPAPKPAADPTYDRQSRLFGDRGQAVLASQKVGIVGVGGAGSLVNEYLARLGVGHLVVVDPDRIELSNVPRVAGSHRRDALPWLTKPERPQFLRALGRWLATPKVRVAQRVARQANPEIGFDAIRGDVTLDTVAASLTDCDYVFLAADSMQARLVVNALVHQYLIPAVQVGAKVQLDKAGTVTDVFSVVRPLTPGLSCLWCNELIKPAKLQEEALTPEQRRQQRYVDDVDVHAPSVITLNAVAAAYAVDNYLMSTVGLRATDYRERWTRFHPLTSTAFDRVIHEIPRSDQSCPECGSNGRLSAGGQRRLPVKSTAGV